MKLSMSLLEYWLQPYTPVSTLPQDEMTISSARMFSYDKPINPDYVYIGRNKDFFEHSHSEEVLLVHKNSVISTNSRDMEEIFNEVLEAFSYFQGWEQQLLEAYHESNPEAYIIEQCQQFYGPILYANASMQITAFSKSYGKGTVNKNWDDFWDYGTFSTESYQVMKDSPFMQRFSKIWECEVFEERTPGENYPWSMMVSQTNGKRNICGQMVFISSEPFKKWQIHLAAPIQRALCLVAGREQATESLSLVNNLLYDFITGQNLTAMNLQTLNEIQGYKEDELFIACFVWQDGVAIAAKNYYERRIQDRFPRVLICNSEYLPWGELPETPVGTIVCIPLKQFSLKQKSQKISAEHYPYCESPRVYLQFFEELKLSYTCSAPMVGLWDVQSLYDQAMTSWKYGIRHYFDCGLYQLVDLRSSEKQRTHALHPIALKMQDYDKHYGTDFYNILKSYLRNERNRVKTAEDLYVHKNTLVYRLEKMEQIFGLNLEDPYEREYLMTSLRVLETK